MHVAAAEKACTCRSKGTKSEWIEKVYDYVLACNRLKGKISQMEVVEDFVSRPHKAVFFCGWQRKGDAGMVRTEAAKGAAWLQWRKVAQKKQKRNAQRRRRAGRGHGGKEN